MFERLKQLDRQTVMPLILAGVIAILLFGAMAGGIRQAGWQEGYLAGLLTNSSENVQAVTPRIGSYGPRGWGGHPFGFIGGIFRFFFFGFLALLFLKFLGFWRWRMHGGHAWHHHPHGPWERRWQPYGEPPSRPQAEPGSQTPPPARPESDQPEPTSWVKV
ncbi:MAG: hypothetical protein KF832_26545 [Caldilineaceae bacterium]|nr:hypothetical protein [Caldilineaceae bacterium]